MNFVGCFRWVLFYQIGGFLVELCKGLIFFDCLDQPATKRLVYNWYGLCYYLRIRHQYYHLLHSQQQRGGVFICAGLCGRLFKH